MVCRVPVIAVSVSGWFFNCSDGRDANNSWKRSSCPLMCMDLSLESMTSNQSCGDPVSSSKYGMNLLVVGITGGSCDERFEIGVMLISCLSIGIRCDPFVSDDESDPTCSVDSVAFAFDLACVQAWEGCRCGTLFGGLPPANGT